MEWNQSVSLIVTILVAVLGGVLYNGVQFRQVDRRFEQVDKRLDDVHRRIDDLCADTMARVGDLRSEMSTNFVQVHQELRDLRTLLQTALQTRSS